MASRLRSAFLNEQSTLYDCAGVSLGSLSELVLDLLSQPLDTSFDCLRLTFVVGGGKKTRQKYDPMLSRALVEALSSLGFLEDRGAALHPSSAGTFKYQHDTDKDLMFMHVFPHVRSTSASADNAATASGTSQSTVSPKMWIVTTTCESLAQRLPNIARQFASKKDLLAFLKAHAADVAAIESKLSNMQAVDDEEMARYESAVELKEKIDVVTREMEAMMDEGKLTSREKKSMLEQLQSKVRELESEAENAPSTKRADKLRDAAKKVQARVEKIVSHEPYVHTLPNEALLKKLYRELADLEHLEKASSGLQSLDVVRKLERKGDCEAELTSAEQACRGLFEDNAETMEMLAALKKSAYAASASVAAKKKNSSGGGGFTKVGGARSKAPSRSSGGGGGGRSGMSAFAALALDDDDE